MGCTDNENLPFRFRQINTCHVKFAMSGKDSYMKLITTYRWQDPRDGSNQDPNETLANGERISG